jgi:hypothetical protein
MSEFVRAFYRLFKQAIRKKFLKPLTAKHVPELNGYDYIISNKSQYLNSRRKRLYKRSMNHGKI